MSSLIKISKLSKSFEGIGARLVQDVDYTVIYEVIPGGPAFKSKALKKDDKIEIVHFIGGG